jgi:poly(glycerol-phosphate) alpha-glucosyltransferase
MKVHVINLFISRNGGGIFTVIKELYNSKFSRSFFESKLLFYGFKDKYSDEDSILLNGEIFSFVKENFFFYSKHFRRKLKTIKGKDEIIHLHSLWMYPSLILSKTKSVKKIISPHGMLDNWALNNGKLKKKISLFLFEKKNLKTASCIHALCYQEYLDIRKINTTTPVAIIPNGINLPEEIVVKRRSKKYILFLARLHPKKGLDNLIEAWANINTQDWELWIVGPDEGEYEYKIQKKNKILQTGKKKIIFINGVFGKEKEKIYREASSFILPSFSEGLPMTILEAWSYKLPVLMTKECNLENAFGKNAAFEILSSIEGIEEGIVNVINMEPRLLKKIGDNGFELVKSVYTWEVVSRKMVKMYSWVLKEIDKPDFIYLN